MYQLIPNVTQLEQNLENFASIIDADEVLLFERATFLVSILGWVEIVQCLLMNVVCNIQIQCNMTGSSCSIILYPVLSLSTAAGKIC